MIESIAEPIITSLQGILVIQGNGKITFINRVKTNKYIFKIENKQKKEVIL